MSDDITHILASWDYRIGRVNARRLTGDDGVEKVQLRIDLGVLQMNASFRPDGKRPFGHPTLLDHFLVRLEKYRDENEGGDEQFQLDPDECAKLQQEAIQFHHRSICFFQLDDFEAVERDTDHILDVLDFVEDYAGHPDMGTAFQQFRPQTLMMQARAIGTRLIGQKNYPEAIKEIRGGIDALQDFYREMDREDMIDASMEIHSLSEWLKEVEKEAERKRPMSRCERLERQLAEAIEKEDFEKAARVRDKLKAATEKKAGSEPKAG